MSKEQQDIAYFLSFCIEQYKNAKGLDGKETMEVFDNYGVLEYLQEFFDVIHTQSYQWILEDIDEFLLKRNYQTLVNVHAGPGCLSLEIVQENLYLLLPSKVSYMTEYLVEENGMTVIDAIKRIYSSVTYSSLATEATKKWHLGPVDLYQELLEE